MIAEADVAAGKLPIKIQAVTCEVQKTNGGQLLATVQGLWFSSPEGVRRLV